MDFRLFGALFWAAILAMIVFSPTSALYVVAVIATAKAAIHAWGYVTGDDFH